MSGDARVFNNIETLSSSSCFPARQGAEGDPCHSDRNIGEICTIDATVKNWVVQLKRDAPLVLDDPKQ
jgi:hypothetical protein